jgi:hypothetical protein
MAYRMKKEPNRGLHNWACYDFSRYQHVPQKLDRDTEPDH